MKTLMYAIILACGVSTAWAATPTPESVKRYMQVTQTEQLIQQMIEQPIDFKSMFAQLEPHSEKLKLYLAKQELFRQAFYQNIDRAALFRSIEQVVAQTYSQAEIDASIKFYETPEGQSILQKTPQFTQNTIQGIRAVLKEALIKTTEDLSQ